MKATVALTTIALFTATPVIADNIQATFQGTFDQISARPDCTKADYPDLVIFTCEKEMALWYFTKPNNAAYPGVVERSIVQDADGSVSVDEDGRSYSSDQDQPIFQKWMASIVALDQKVKEEMAKKHGAQ